MHGVALVVGAGIGGLAAALALRSAGWDVQVFERTREPRELGFGLMLAPNAMAALSSLGVADRVRAAGVPLGAGEIRRTDGRVLRRFPDPRANGWRVQDLPIVVLRSALHGALLNAIGRDCVATGREAVAFDDAPDGVRLRLSDNTTVDGTILIGADGIGSAIRARLHPSEPAPRSSGYFGLRGASPSVQPLHGLQFLSYFEPGVECALARASTTTIYWYLSLLADDVHRGPADAISVLQRCTAGFERTFHEIVAATPGEALRLDELFVRGPLDAWGRGPVTLLGDAAHPLLPHTGQGAAQALEDAAALGEALARRGEPIAALRQYERSRSQRTRRFIKLGPRIARVTTTRNPIVTWLRNGAIRAIPTFAITRAMAGKR
jgi:2-polyprenyl-6-methoxyphenol hydroxylase-like FAD-dependent oxidoreductase